jgi:hypothetical protein
MDFTQILAVLGRGIAYTVASDVPVGVDLGGRRIIKKYSLSILGYRASV